MADDIKTKAKKETAKEVKAPAVKAAAKDVKKPADKKPAVIKEAAKKPEIKKEVSKDVKKEAPKPVKPAKETAAKDTKKPVKAAVINKETKPAAKVAAPVKPAAKVAAPVKPAAKVAAPVKPAAKPAGNAVKSAGSIKAVKSDLKKPTKKAGEKQKTITKQAYKGQFIKVTLVKSTIGGTRAQKATVQALGLKKIGQIKLHQDNPAIRGMVNKVSHLVKLEEA